ncbi:MAG: hypothetical protein IKD68_07335 [Solobacterium sp.]|nr:hypothetical protein [Solobacterium sp.]
MRVLNIHGYQGSAENSAYIALQSIGCEILSPQIDYDAEEPEPILDQLSGIAEKKKIELLVGTSLGGFFAAVLSADLNLPVILVNPCMLPFLHLPRIGYQGDITSLIRLFGKLALIDRGKVSCIVGAEDELIDSHDFDERLFGNSRFRIIAGGGHSGATLPLKEYFEFVLNG